jgi:glutamine synthetase
MVCLEIMDHVAARMGMKVLAHEKPYKGINGSGKHNNWSMSTDSGKNLCKPGKTAETQAEFFAFTAGIAAGIAAHGDILRVAVAHAGNDHRLGAQEAPPAIMTM